MLECNCRSSQPRGHVEGINVAISGEAVSRTPSSGLMAPRKNPSIDFRDTCTNVHKVHTWSIRSVEVTSSYKCLYVMVMVMIPLSKSHKLSRLGGYLVGIRSMTDLVEGVCLETLPCCLPPPRAPLLFLL